MKKVLFLLALLLSNLVFASDIGWEKLILEKMIQSISSAKEVKVYTDDENLRVSLEDSDFIDLVASCNKSDFVIGENEFSSVCEKPTIVLKYRDYLNDSCAVGVFFWQKGRPTIRFSAEKLKNFGLHIDGELSKFVTTKTN